MSTELPKQYDAKHVDQKWYHFWEEKNFFKADPASSKPAYAIVIPPPNVTGALHMGHALVNTLQDVLIRYHRMAGFEALWVPGTDHAGISTQTVVERKLIKETGKRRKDFPRDEFLSHVWKWKEENEHIIVDQLKKLGCSCDWSRQRFTMDDRNNRAVRRMFKKLFDEGLIYRGDYLVNWDPVTQTALADDEVEYDERDSFLWHFRYPLTDGSGHIEIATTRPETMLGDTAVAVSPKDDRFSHLVGKTLTLPIMNREIPIIADIHVDPEFGTGCVKVTPAHDPNDYQIGINHELPFVNIMTPDGKLNENAGEFSGLTMEEGRAGVIEKMKELGFFVKAEPHQNRVGLSYRSKAVIEPYMSKQWFVKMSGFATKLQEAVRGGKVKLIPQSWENTWFHWVDNLRDWCISRQLWWGHRIPIWYNKEDRSKMICFDGDGLPPEVEQDPDAWEQDPDVLDTWFSSQLWPFAALGWPDDTAELEKFYPNSVLVTGHDILFFWVARMVLAGEYVMGDVPFPETFLHGLIYGKSYWRKGEDGTIHYCTPEEHAAFDTDPAKVPSDVSSKWEKMSKSKGNIIDPLEVIDQYGTDAIRMALCAGSPQLRQIDLDRRRFEEFKNFANKVWNGARFIFMHLDGDNPLSKEAFAQGLDQSLLDLEDRWILSTLNRTVRQVTQHLKDYQFDHAAIKAYDFFWKEFCAYYLELAKPVLFGKAGTPEIRTNKQRVLAIALTAAIRLLHPMAPFITEELFQQLKERLGSEGTPSDPYTTECLSALRSEACIVAAYPTPLAEEEREVLDTFDLLSDVVYTIRNIRGEMKVPPGTPCDVWVVESGDTAAWTSVRDHQSMIPALVRIGDLHLTNSEPQGGFFSTGMVRGIKVAVKLPDELLVKERARLEKSKLKLEKNRDKLKGQLANESFVSRAPKELVDKQKQALGQAETELAEVEAKLASL